MIHKLLQKHLGALGIDPEIGPQSKEEWQRLLSKMNTTYSEQEQHRYLLNRSLEISSREMRVRWQNLQLLEEQWRSLGECTPDMIMMVDLYGRITFVNRGRNHQSKESLIGKDILSLYPPVQRDWLFEIFESAKLDRALKCVELQEEEGTGGRWYTIRVNPVVRVGSIIGIVVVETDITDVRKVVIETYVEALNSFRHATY